MKFILIALLLSLSSCALYKEITEKVPANVSQTDDNSQPAVKIIDERRQKSSQGQATISIIKYSTNSNSVSIYFEKDMGLEYKAGHSLEVKIDNETTVLKVEPTKDGSILRFEDPAKLVTLIKGHKDFQIELLSGTKKTWVIFDISKIKLDTF